MLAKFSTFFAILTSRGRYFAQILLFVTAPLIWPVFSSGQDLVKKPLLHCPVVGIGAEARRDCCPSGYCSRKPLGAHCLEYKGGKILFCCDKCLARFKKTPEPFTAAANHQLVASGQAKQITCPLCGGTPNGAVHVEIAGIKILLCGEECRNKLRASKAEAQMQLIFGENAFARAFAVRPAKTAPAGPEPQ